MLIQKSVRETRCKGSWQLLFCERYVEVFTIAVRKVTVFFGQSESVSVSEDKVLTTVTQHVGEAHRS